MRTILIIEDSDGMRDMLATALRDLGYATLEAADGTDGVALARQRLPDLILSDIAMRQMDGCTVMATLRDDPATAAIPFMLMTGHPEAVPPRAGMSLGADDFLIKPFGMAELRQRVEARLHRRDLLQRLADKRLEALRASLSLSLPHELLTPLSAILGSAELIRTEHGALDRSDLIELVDNISVSARRLQHLIYNYLHFAEIELRAGSPERLAELRAGSTASAQTVIAAAAQAKASDHKRQADLNLQLAEGSAPLDPAFLERIVGELVDNAFKFSSPGSSVEVAAWAEASAFVLRVKDLGRGMRPEQIAEVGAGLQFERRFYEQQGLGLGLATAKRLAELLGGRLTIQSAPAAGTRVEVRLPWPKQ